jgi:hypothetical protein
VITGHCSGGFHEKCLHPGRCSCDCHPKTEVVDVPHEGHAAAEATFPCTACPCSFRDQDGLDHHTRTIHPEPEDTTMPGGNTSTPLDEPCPDPDCSAHFATTQQRGAHYRFNPTHKPADLVTTYDIRKGAKPRAIPAKVKRSPTPAKPKAVVAAPPAVVTTDQGAVIDRQWTIGPLDIALTVHLSDDTADALRKVLELGAALDGLTT